MYLKNYKKVLLDIVKQADKATYLLQVQPFLYLSIKLTNKT